MARFKGIPIEDAPIEAAPARGPRFKGIPIDQEPGAPAAPAQAAPQEPVYDAMGNVTGYTQAALEAARGHPLDNSGSAAVGRGIINGVPVVGPYLLGGIERGAAGVRSWQSGRPYEDELAAVRGEGERLARENPKATLGGEITGGIVGTAPLAMAAPAAFGLTQATLPARIGASALSGTALGSADAAARSGGDIGAIGRGAGWGGLFGLAGPMAGALVGRGMRYANDALASRGAGEAGGAAMGMLAQDMQAAGGPQVVRQRMAELGPEAMLLDAAPSFEGRAQGAAVIPETRQRILEALMARNEGKNRRLAADLDSAIGPAPVPSQIEAGLGASRNLTAEAYGPVMRNARAVDTRDLANRLEEAAINLRGPAQRAVRDVRNMLDIPGTSGHLDPNPQALLNTRQAIDGLLANEANPQVVRQLTMARREVDGALMQAVPGIKEVDARFAELARQSEGLQRGSQVLDGGKTAIRPAEMAQELQAGALPQGEFVGPSAVPFRVRQGARAEIDRQVGTKANDLVALRNVVKGDGDWNRAKLAQVFGEGQANHVLLSVDREAAFERAYNNLVNNSMTAVRERSAAGMKVRGEGSASPDIGTVVAGSVGGPAAVAAALAARGGRMAFNEAVRSADLTRNQEMARLLVERAGPNLDSLITSLGRRADRIGQSDARARAVERVANALIQAQAARAHERMPRF